MQNLFGIIDSQSRYELQAALLFNPNGLVADESNRFGIVDSSDRVSRVATVSNNFKENFTEGALSEQPLLSIDEFGSGLNALDTRSGKLLSHTNSSFQPNWDVEFFIAFKIKMVSGGGNNMIFSITRNDVSNGNISGITVQSFNGKIQYALRNDDLTKNKVVRSTADTYVDGNVYDVIVHWKGTNDALDSKLYIDETEVQDSSTVVNQDLTGEDIFPGTGWITCLASRITDTDTNLDGYLGKVICGYGTPNVELVTKALNATTY